MKRVLLLGGGGFIGLNVQNDLAKKHINIRVFGRSLANKPEGESNIEYFTGSLSDTEKLRAALMDVDVVVHMVSTTVPSTSNNDPVFDIESNLISTIRLLEICKDLGIKRIIFLSSGGTIYGRPQSLPVNELHSLNPICSYGIVKIAIENYLNLFKELYEFSIVILRVSNPYGPHQAKLGLQGVIGTFMNKIYHNEPIEIWGDGSVGRDYIYITDVVSIISRTILQDDIQGTFNIGSGYSVSLTELLAAITEICGKNALITYKPGRSFDIKDIYLDISKARQQIGWQPEIDIKTGLKLYFDWINSAR